jgi:hypothetical protein
MLKGLLGKPDLTWLVAAAVASVLLALTVFVPLWRMNLVAPQYPKGLVMYAYGNRFEGETEGYSETFDAVKEINGLNHYIGMKPIEKVVEMDLFIPGVLATIAGLLLASFIRWKSAFFRVLVIAGAWFLPVFFVADLQYHLYDYGHTMDPRAALSMDAFTPKVVGTTKVWNFHSETGFEIGFYLMVAAAVVITVAPLAAAWLRRRRSRSQAVAEAVQQVRQSEGSVAG